MAESVYKVIELVGTSTVGEGGNRRCREGGQELAGPAHRRDCRAGYAARRREDSHLPREGKGLLQVRGWRLSRIPIGQPL
jgi:hypothetical protein